MLFALLVVFVLEMIVIFGSIGHCDYFAHLADDSVEVDEAVAEHANLEVVTHRPKQPV